MLFNKEAVFGLTADKQLKVSTFGGLPRRSSSLDFAFPLPGARVRSPVGDLTSRLLHGAAQKKI